MHSRSTAKTQRRRGGAGSGAQGEELGWARADESTRQTRELLFVEPWQACYIIYIIIVGYIYIYDDIHINGIYVYMYNIV